MTTLPLRVVLRLVALGCGVALIVTLPFVIAGEAYLAPWLAGDHGSWAWWVGGGIFLLAVDSLAPVPSTLVIAVVAARVGVWGGILTGAVGLSAGVVTAWLVGRVAVKRVNSLLFSATEQVRVEAAMQRSAAWTLICLRPLPVLAETSVMLAAAGGVSLARTCRITAVPNLVIAILYAVIAQASWLTTALSLLALFILCTGVWRAFARRHAP